MQDELNVFEATAMAVKLPGRRIQSGSTGLVGVRAAKAISTEEKL
jgi:hypothetical protein